MAASSISRKLRRVLADPGIKEIADLVNKLSPEVLIQVFDRNGLSTTGTMEELRERQLRYDIQRVFPSVGVRMNESDFRGDRLPVTTAELLIHKSHEKLAASEEKRSDGTTKGGATRITALESQTSALDLRASSPSTSNQPDSSVPEEVVETRAPSRQNSRLWSALATLPRLFLTRGYREVEAELEVPLEQGRRANFSEPPQRVMGAIERGRAESNNFYYETTRESELPHPRECSRGPNRESSASRLYDVCKVESSSSSESEGEIAASGSGAASLGPASRGGSNAYREYMARAVSAVRAFRDWRISCSGWSSGETAEFLRRLQELQKCTRLSDREILDAVPSVLADRELQWYHSLGNEKLTLREFIAQLRDQFVRRLDREDLYEELRARTQAPGVRTRFFSKRAVHSRAIRLSSVGGQATANCTAKFTPGISALFGNKRRTGTRGYSAFRIRV